MKRYAPILFPLAILLLIKFLFIFDFFDKLEYLSQDQMFRIRGAKDVSGDLVIVAIDDASFSSLDMTWPFPRNLHAKLIENLNRAGVRQIVFDVEFTESGDSAADLHLAETAARYNNVIFAGKLIHSSDQGVHVQKLEPIRPISERGLSWGIVNIDTDDDSVIRRYTLFEPFDQERVYTLGIASLANHRVYQPNWTDHIRIEKGKLQVIDKAIPIVNDKKALINYYGPNETFLTLSYASILDDSLLIMPGQIVDGTPNEIDEYYDILNSGILEGKTVLVGATTAELHDNFATPFSGRVLTPGVEIHANFIEMVHQGDYLSRLNLWLYLLGEFILLLLLWFVYRKLRPQLGAVLLIGLIVMQGVLAYQLFARQSIIIPVVQSMLVFILVYVAALLNHYIETMKEKRFIRTAFQQYMAPELVNELLRSPQKLAYGGSLQEITVLFSDIRSFTTYSENHKPEETVQILKEYLTAMVEIIVRNKGILDKFVGDEIMALFGTPVPLPNHALCACRVALEMRERLTEMQQGWAAEGRESFEIGIGINTGYAVVGNLGSEQIFDYTAIGDTINLGARLEGLNKEYDTAKHIIISEFTLEHVQDMVEVNFIDEVKVKGKNKAVKVYELVRIL
ncbi:MAG: adenylate/guanylate cyclase domain-containing protein [Candidatus Cloacimonadaceae bacterium]|nr:adenylate/guanylate cyclase domain-containing protein [Candidatus Cloacimonadaceae bacterium]